MVVGKRKLIINNIICFLFALYFITMFISVETYTLLSSGILYIVMIGLVALFINNFKEIYKNNRNTLILVCLLILNVLIGCVINNSGLGSVWIITELYLIILNASSINLSKVVIKYLSLILGIFGIYFATLSEGFNTNTYGYITLVLSLFLIYYFEILKKEKKIKSVFLIIQILIYIFFFNFVILSESRSVLFAYLFFGVYVILTRMFSKNRLIYKVIPFFIILGQLIFVFIYVQLWLNNIYIDFSFSDKNFYSGREAIWYELWNVFKDNALYGIGSNYHINSFVVLNVHNSLFNILVVYGLINFIGFLILFLKFVLNSSKKNKYNFIFLLTLVFVGYFETNLLWNSTIILFILVSFFAYNNIEIKYKNLKK